VTEVLKTAHTSCMACLYMVRQKTVDCLDEVVWKELDWPFFSVDLLENVSLKYIFQ